MSIKADASDISRILMDVRVLMGGSHAHFKVGDDNGTPWLQYVDPALGNDGNGRKWRISTHSTRSEVVQTAFMAVLAWNEHELREMFKYKGQAIFSPHYDVEALVELSAAHKHDVRA